MRQSARRGTDVTGAIATGNVAGDMVLSSVLATLEDERDQVVLLAHLA